jgi:hypothetical protein
MNRTLRACTARAAGILLLACCAFPVLAQDAAPRHLLRLSFEPGKVLHYRMSMIMQQKMNMGAKPVDMDTAMGITFKTEVLEVVNGKAKVRQTFERVTVKSDNAIMKVDYDSADPESRAGPMAVLEDLVGESVTVHVDERAHYSGVEMSEDFPKAAIDVLGGDMEKLLSQSVPELPDQPVAIGESWETTKPLQMAQFGEAQAKVVNKLTEVSGGHARIDMQLTIDTSNLQMPGGGKFKFEKAGGYTVVDFATGAPIDGESTMQSQVIAGQMQMDMTMKVSIAACEPVAPKAPADAKSAGDGK